MTKAETAALRVVPTGAALGADIEGLDLSADLDQSMFERIREAWAQHLVLRFREADFEGAEKAFRGIGLVPRLPVTAAEVFRFREEYVKNRNLTAWSFVNPADPSEIVDVILTHDLTTLGTKRVTVPGGSVTILAKDDLIRMKEAAGRPQDREDVRALRALR